MLDVNKQAVNMYNDENEKKKRNNKQDGTICQQVKADVNKGYNHRSIIEMMNYFPWESGGRGIKNVLYTKHDCIFSQITMPDLPSFFARLWWDETIPTVVTKATQPGH